jgi:hypothetical protein
MQKQRVFVSVVGFSDVERHALNTVFRLSEDRDLSYAPWAPLSGADATPRTDKAQVVLVDGSSAEAVLSHARQMPEGQWLIWVGPDAPDHAWRVLERPIQWSHILHDLDAVFAARQADSGLLDLDITSPGLLLGEPSGVEGAPRRALLVGMAEREVALLRAGRGGRSRLHQRRHRSHGASHLLLRGVQPGRSPHRSLDADEGLWEAQP